MTIETAFVDTTTAVFIALLDKEILLEAVDETVFILSFITDDSTVEEVIKDLLIDLNKD